MSQATVGTGVGNACLGQVRAEGTGTVSFTLSPAAYELLADVAVESGESAEDLIRKALGLLKLAMDARRQGKRLGIAREGDRLETETEVFQSLLLTYREPAA